MPIFLPTPSPILPNHLIISVIIPVRNEAQNIHFLLQDLQQQTLLPTFFEVWVIDDNSEDATASIVQNFQASYKLSLLPSDNQLAHLSPKKRAIQTALQFATGKLIVCTDGDCRVEPDWLLLFAQCQEKTQAHWISGGVAIKTKNSLPYEKETALSLFYPSNLPPPFWQSIEFSSLVGSGAITLAYGFPTMANGANLAYTRESFEAVEGFKGNEHLASGDDEFLLHKIAQKFPDKVFFLKNPDHTVFTYPQATFKDFYAQRKRWGSKWSHYKNIGIKLLAVAIFGANLAFLFLILWYWVGKIDSPTFAVLACLKLLPEFILLRNFAFYFRLFSPKKQYFGLPFYLIFVQLTYPLYVVFFGLISLSGKTYFWKGRRLE
jgi:glycosyltransferase involved in cell wall biosynthesis